MNQIHVHSILCEYQFQVQNTVLSAYSSEIAPRTILEEALSSHPIEDAFQLSISAGYHLHHLIETNLLNQKKSFVFNIGIHVVFLFFFLTSTHTHCFCFCFCKYRREEKKTKKTKLNFIYTIVENSYTHTEKRIRDSLVCFVSLQIV